MLGARCYGLALLVRMSGTSGWGRACMQGEVPLEYRAVARLRTAVAMEMIGILSTGRLFRQRKGDAGREWEYIGGAGDCEAREGNPEIIDPR